MKCVACGKDQAPIIEMSKGDTRNEFGASSGRYGFVYTCSNPSCHAILGPVVRNVPKAHVAKPSPIPAAVDVSDLQATPAPTTNVTAPDVPNAIAPSGYVAQMRARLEFLDKVLAPLNEERDFLRRTLDRKPRSRMPRNVVPIEIAKA